MLVKRSQIDNPSNLVTVAQKCKQGKVGLHISSAPYMKHGDDEFGLRVEGGAYK